MNPTKILTQDGFVRADGSTRISEADLEALAGFAALRGRFSKCVEHLPALLTPPDSDDDSEINPIFGRPPLLHRQHACEVQEPF
ncbi:unnamed protein product [Urochloa humidicola]